MDVESNYNENRGFHMRKRIGESSAAPLKGSLRLSSASKDSLQSSEATSGMTLPTGVSDFLLDCLDEDSTKGFGIESSNRADSYSSPEIFRDESGVGGESTSAPHHGAATGTLDSNQPVADMVDSSIQKISNSEDLFPNMTDPHVNSEEIVPESLFPKRTIYQCLRNPPEVCSIITASPEFRPPKILKRPLDKKRIFPSPGVTE
ncbi:hypothetical protein lerEdw1_016288, partial [Lerista edwardsae]